MARIDWDNMKVTFGIKGNPRKFDTENLKDMRDFNAIMKARPPVKIYINEDGSVN